MLLEHEALNLTERLFVAVVVVDQLLWLLVARSNVLDLRLHSISIRLNGFTLDDGINNQSQTDPFFGFVGKEFFRQHVLIKLLTAPELLHHILAHTAAFIVDKRLRYINFSDLEKPIHHLTLNPIINRALKLFFHVFLNFSSEGWLTALVHVEQLEKIVI